MQAKPFSILEREIWPEAGRLGSLERVKANGGAAGVDGQTIEDFEARLGPNL